MNKTVAVFLIHVETGCMIFLKRVILQIYRYEEQPVCNRGKRTVPVYDKPAPVIAIPAIHTVVGEIPVMGFLKIREQPAELFRAKTRQGTEFLFVVVIIHIFHSAKIRLRA